MSSLSRLQKVSQGAASGADWSPQLLSAAWLLLSAAPRRLHDSQQPLVPPHEPLPSPDQAPPGPDPPPALAGCRALPLTGLGPLSAPPLSRCLTLGPRETKLFPASCCHGSLYSPGPLQTQIPPFLLGCPFPSLPWGNLPQFHPHRPPNPDPSWRHNGNWCCHPPPPASAPPGSARPAPACAQQARVAASLPYGCVCCTKPAAGRSHR